MTSASSDRVPAEFQNLLLSLSTLDLTDVGLGDACRATALQALRDTTRSSQLALLHLRAPEQHALSALALWCCPGGGDITLPRCPQPLLPLLWPDQGPLLLDRLSAEGFEQPALRQLMEGPGPTLWLPVAQGTRVVGLLGLGQPAVELAPDALHQALRPVLAWLGVALHAWSRAPQRAHDALARSHADYQQLFEVAGVGIARVAIDGSLQDVNQRFADICRRQRASMVGLNVHDLTHPDEQAVSQAMSQAMLQGQHDRYTLEKRYLAPGGACVWVQLTVALVRDELGRPKHFVSVIEDISQRRQYQEAILSAQTAERASKAKTEFLSRMSHELRTPLNAMLGFAQLLRVDPRHPLNDPQRQKVQYIEQAGAHLLAMLTDVLDLSRIEAGSLPLSLEPLRVRSAVQEALALVQHQAQAQNLLVHAQDIDDKVHVRADHVRLRQVLVNLLGNAIKYNRPNGRVHLEVQVIKPHVVFAIHDTGMGLSPEQQAHLFEPFNRLGAERSGVEGTGIGLVIVKRLLGLMNGRIEVSSVQGQGSVFRVMLPWVTAPTMAPPGAGPIGDPTGGPKAPGALLNPVPAGEPPRVRRLLYAEDNPVNVELVRQVLRMRPQWQLEVALSGAEAITMALTQPPDLLLLDMHLGDMNGLDVADRLAQHAHTAGIPKAGLSADAMPDQVKAARERGIVTYLTKPLEVARLLQLLDNHHSATAAGPGPSPVRTTGR
jgi:PAS domain S-box-containing protein